MDRIVIDQNTLIIVQKIEESLFDDDFYLVTSSYKSIQSNWFEIKAYRPNRGDR